MFTFHKVADRLYIGNEVTSTRREFLRRHNVTHILAAGFGLKKHFPEVFRYKQIDMLDLPDYQIQRHFPDCVAFIEDGIENGGTVFVHCFQGVSRSATIVIAYLMYKQQLPLSHALRLVKDRHSDADPNYGFLEQLEQLEDQLKSGNFAPIAKVEKVDKVYCACTVF